MLQEEKNNGALYDGEAALDYKMGAETGLVVPVRNVSDWTPYLPDFETQKDNAIDFLECVTMSGMHHGIEMQVNYDMAHGLYSQEALDYFKSAGYIVNGKFKASVRYNAVMNGTTTEGQYMNVAADHYRADGLLPDADFPVLPNMTWEQFYTMPMADQITKARAIFKYIKLGWQWGAKANIPQMLVNTPVQVGTPVCAGWNTSPIIQKCDQPMQHCTTVYKIDEQGNYLDLDHYDPYLKKLAPDYPLVAVMQYVATPVTVQPPAVIEKPVHTFNENMVYGDTDATTNGDVTWLQKALAYDSMHDSAPFDPKYVCGTFGARTMKAVMAFQLKYKQDVLIPAGTDVPTGKVLQFTRAKLNTLYN